MKAMTRHDYGGPETLRLDAVDVPKPGPEEVRMRVMSASVNPADRYFMLGTPYLVRASVGIWRPRQATFGSDVAGVVDAVGGSVRGLKVGDRVVGGSRNGFAEYATVREDHAAVIPDTVSFTDAAALPVAGATALQGWRKADLQPGDQVLVNNSSGGVGHFAVQLAAAMGAEVTAVCSGRNADLLRGWGATDVIDYTTTDYATLGRTWDVLFDCQGNRPARVNRDLLTDSGRWVLVNGPMTSRWVGPMRYIAGAFAATAFSSRKVVQFTADETAGDLAILLDHVAAGTLVPHVERTFPLIDLPGAMDHLATNRTRGKLLIDIG